MSQSTKENILILSKNATPTWLRHAHCGACEACGAVFTKLFPLQLASELEFYNILGWRGLPGTNTPAYLAYNL